MRQIINFNAKWAFTKMADAIPTEISNKWDFVNLPHCWNAIDGQDGDNDYFRGTAYYAKKLTKSELPEADRYYLEIRGANSSADVYLNGKCLAHHDGGYSTWRVDLTESLEAMNLLVIAVDNAANDRVYPQMADFTFYGGLYRDVNIVCVNDTHFDLEYFGSNGIKVTPEISGKDANVNIEVFVKNLKEGQKLTFVATVLISGNHIIIGIFFQKIHHIPNYLGALLKISIDHANIITGCVLKSGINSGFLTEIPGKAYNLNGATLFLVQLS